MEKIDLELFKEALNEAWDNKIRREVESCTEEIITSERHKAAMQAILDGTYEKKSVWKLTKAKVAAILVAAALLLASCAVIYRNEIRDFVEEIFADFTKLTYSDKDIDGQTIDTVYAFTYVPEGYVLEKSTITPIKVRYEYRNANNDFIIFEQKVLDTASFGYDIESEETETLKINDIEIYCITTKQSCFYLWNNGHYTFEIESSVPIPTEELTFLIDIKISK